MKAIIAVLAVAVVCTPGAAAAAQTVYRSVEDGVTTFSDTPPADGAAEVIDIEVPPRAEDGLLESRLAEMRETTDRMAEDRREREQQRAILRTARADAKEPPAPPAEPSVVWAGGYWPTFGRPGFRPRPPFRPPVRPRPPARVPPGWSVLEPGNAQLMRPIVSSRK